VTVVDREDRLLRAFTTADGQWRLPLDPKDVDQNYLKMLFAFEDQRFYQHRGVDPHGLLRAVVQFAKHRRLVSGGSTLTMQVARLLEGKHERTAGGKLRQMRAQSAGRIETRDPAAVFGSRRSAISKACGCVLAYFGKEPRRLSTGEAALVALRNRLSSPPRSQSGRGQRNAIAS
jgi:penicillin-binding protein 1C